ncbi:hypothetical protein CQA49_09330, partial [Helicobacter sp. MIT 00-7814]|uniref:DEAD/DEAH box helicase family protein n=1 Tax=unclassified Helicobacter TaxID=2593540 RepID=UPI000E390F0F
YATRRFKDKHYSVSFDLAVKQLQKDFSEHIAQNAHLQDLITKAFNEKRNIYANPKEVTYSATKTYEGANPAIKLRPTQNRAVQKAVFGDKNILLNHEVGAGKTYTLITTAMELRRTNKSKKPLIAVPNHLVTQFQNDFLNLYPNAKIMSIQSVSDKNFSNLLNQIAYNDFDSVIVGHSVFDSINMPYAYQRDFYEDLIEEKKRLAGEASGSVERRIQRELKSLEDRLAGVQGNKKTNKDFTELGFDSLLLDEAHEYKNLPFASAYESKQMGSKLGSAKAMNLLLKTSFLNKNGKKIVFATGTPMSNSLLEVHHMLRHLDPQGLKMFGIEHIDNFINDFVRIEKVLETKPTGERVFEDYIVGTRNNKTLMNFVNRVFDTIDMKEVIDQANLSGVKVILPNVLAQSAMIKKSKLVAELFDDIVLADAKYLKENPQGAMENGINHLTIFNNARKLSLDPRLLAPKRANEAIAKNPELLKDTKIHQSAQNIATIAKEWEKDKGTQVVFCDLGVNDILGFNAHKELKNQLLAQKDSSGKAIFEPQEVQIIGDWKKEKYKDLYKDVNSGKVRVLITTTAKTGTGANIQKRMVAMHHLDSPYRPSDYTQRIGRLVRQGNELAIRASNEKSEFFAKNIVYATEETLDSRMFEMLEAKSRAFRNFYKGSDVETELNVKEMIDYDLMAAESSGNKNGIELVKVNKDIDELESLKQSQLREFSNKEKDIREFSEKLAKLESELKTIDTFKPSFEGAKLEFNHQAFELDLKESLNKPASIVFDDEAQKANLQALREAMNKQKETILQKLESGIPYNLYSYNGADLYAVKDNLGELTFFFEKESKRYFLEGTRRMLSNFSPSDSLNFLKILQNHTRKEGEKLREIAREKTNLAKAKARKEAFDEQERLDALLEYAQSLQEAVDKKIKELIPKPASLAKYAIVSGAGGLGAYAQAYERDNNQYKAL